MIYHGEDLGDYYLVSNTGEIKGVKTGIIRKKNTNHEWYYFVVVSLGSRNDKPLIKVHRAVAETFLQNPNNYPVINHIDRNKLNNNVENLEFCSYSYNTIHAYENELIQQTNQVPVYQIDPQTGEILHKYKSIKEAQLSLGILKYTGTIGDCLRGRIKTAYGYTWKRVS